MKKSEIIEEYRKLSETAEFSEYLDEKTKGRSRQYKHWYKKKLLSIPVKALEWLAEWDEIKSRKVKKNT